MHESPYPIFFPRFSSIETGYQKACLYYDPAISPGDIGDYATREAAVADWAADRLLAELKCELEAVDYLQTLPLLVVGVGRGAEKGPSHRPALSDPLVQLLDQALQVVETLDAAVPLPQQLRLPLMWEAA